LSDLDLVTNVHNYDSLSQIWKSNPVPVASPYRNASGFTCGSVKPSQLASQRHNTAKIRGQARAFMCVRMLDVNGRTKGINAVAGYRRMDHKRNEDIGEEMGITTNEKYQNTLLARYERMSQNRISKLFHRCTPKSTICGGRPAERWNILRPL
jgi:hypothetical protein